MERGANERTERWEDTAEKKAFVTPPTLYFPSFQGLGSLVAWVGVTGSFPRLMSEFSRTYLYGVGVSRKSFFRLEFVSEIDLSGVFPCLHWNLSQDWVYFCFFVLGVCVSGSVITLQGLSNSL